MNCFSNGSIMVTGNLLLKPSKRNLMKSMLTLPASLLMGLLLSSAAHANDHKVLGMIAMPRNAPNDLTLRIPVCRVVKRIQLVADRGDIKLSGASVYFKAARMSSQSLSVPSSIKEGQTTSWININSDNDNKRCVSKITLWPGSKLLRHGDIKSHW